MLQNYILMDHGRYSYNLYIIPISDNKINKFAYNNNPLSVLYENVLR